MQVSVRGRVEGSGLVIEGWRVHVRPALDAPDGQTVIASGKLTELAPGREAAGYRDVSSAEGGALELTSATWRAEGEPARARWRLGRMIAALALAALLALALGLGRPLSLAEAIMRGGWLALAITGGWMLAAGQWGHLHVFPMAPRRDWLPHFGELVLEPATRRGHAPAGTRLTFALLACVSLPFAGPFLLAKLQLLPPWTGEAVLGAHGLLWIPAAAAVVATPVLTGARLNRGRWNWWSARAALRGEVAPLRAPFGYARRIGIKREWVSAARGKREIITLTQEAFGPPSAGGSRPWVALPAVLDTNDEAEVGAWPPALALESSRDGRTVVFASAPGSSPRRALQRAMACHVADLITGPVAGIAYTVVISLA